MDPQEQQEEVVTPELTEVEQEAYSQGWRPREQFEAEEKNQGKSWIPADEFVRRKPLFDKIEELKNRDYHTRRELTEVKQTLNTLAAHHKKVREVEYQRALKELQYQRKAAMEEFDHDAVIELEEKIDDVKQGYKEFEAQIKQETKQQAAQPSPEFVTWVQANPWYNQDQEMHNFADGAAIAYVNNKRAKNQEVTPDEVYEHVSNQVRRAFPEKFNSGPKSSPVDSGNTAGRQAAPKREAFHLTPEEEQAAKQFETLGLMTRAEYIAELKKLGGRK